MFLLGCCFACRQLKNQITWLSWCLWIVVLEKTHESSLDIKDIKLVNPKGNQLWIFIGRINAEAEAPILWPPDAKSQLIGKRLWCWEKIEHKSRKGQRRMRRLDGITLSMDMSWANLGDSEGQRSLEYCNPWVTLKRWTQLSNWTIVP